MLKPDSSLMKNKIKVSGLNVFLLLIFENPLNMLCLIKHVDVRHKEGL